MDDRRVHIYFENALKFIRRCEEEYDLIIVDSSQRRMNLRAFSK